MDLRKSRTCQSSGTTDGSDRYNSSSAVLPREPDLSEPSDSRQINQTENPLLPVDNPGGIAQEINSPMSRLFRRSLVLLKKIEHLFKTVN